MKLNLALIALTVSTVWSQGPSSASALALQPPDGAAVYKKACAICHDASKTTRAPDRETLKQRSPESILSSMLVGTMVAQASALSEAEKQAVSVYLAARPFGAEKPAEKPAPGATEAGLCAAGPAAFRNPFAGPLWNGWGADLTNSRFQPAKGAGLTAGQVPRLKLKWAFGFPGSNMAFGQPTVAAGRVFAGSDKGMVYSLDATTGCIYWRYQAAAGVRTAISIGRSVKGQGSARYVLYFGDLKANVYAVNAATGELLWKTQVDEHPLARITGAPALEGKRLYAPVSSIEEVPGANPTYECCRFRGSLVALDVIKGEKIWKTYTIAETPQPTKKNNVGTQLWGPAGAAIWSAPTVDLKRRAIYVGTGNAFTEPAAMTSDSVMAFDMDSGKLLWSRQATPKDTFLIGCTPNNKSNCAEEVGPDFDFGNSPILRTLPGGRRLLVAGQKSGVVFGLDPDRQGEIVWQFRAGKGSALGGIEWGCAADDQMAYVPVSDVLGPPQEAGGIFGIRLATGEKVWHTPAPKLECTGGRGCSGAQSAAVTAIPGVVFSGSIDGHLRAYSTVDGRILWDYNTAQEFTTVNQVKAKGGSIDSAGPTVAGGMVYTNSGYGLFRGMPGNVLLAFSADDK